MQIRVQHDGGEGKDVDRVRVFERLAGIVFVESICKALNHSINLGGLARGLVLGLQLGLRSGLQLE